MPCARCVTRSRRATTSPDRPRHRKAPTAEGVAPMIFSAPGVTTCSNREGLCGGNDVTIGHKGEVASHVAGPSLLPGGPPNRTPPVTLEIEQIGETLPVNASIRPRKGLVALRPSACSRCTRDPSTFQRTRIDLDLSHSATAPIKARATPIAAAHSTPARSKAPPVLEGAGPSGTGRRRRLLTGTRREPRIVEGRAPAPESNTSEHHARQPSGPPRDEHRRPPPGDAVAGNSKRDPHPDPTLPTPEPINPHFDRASWSSRGGGACGADPSHSCTDPE